MEDEERRTLLLSLDGATWNILEPLVRAGQLPTIQGILEDGISGPLQSVIPPVTTAAWTSFATGVHPARHGVFTFHCASDGGRSRSLVNSTSTRFPTFWHYLDSAGKRSLVVNLPMTYPISSLPIEGVSGLLAPSTEKKNAASDLGRRCLGEIDEEYRILRNPSSDFSPHEHPQRFIDALCQNASSRANLTKKLLGQSTDWDVCMMHIQSTDVLQHPLWEYLTQSNEYNEEQVKDITDDYYTHIDSILEDVISTAEATAGRDPIDIILLSDHGFQRMDRRVYFDALLADLGHLSWSQPTFRTQMKQKSLQLARKLDILNLRARIFDPETVTKLGDAARGTPVDWENTSAWGYGNLYGYVYLQEGADRQAILSDLSSLSIDTVDRPIVESVVDVAKEYDDTAPGIPDLIVVPKPGISFETANGPEASVTEPVDPDRDFHVGGHAQNGIFAMQGEDLVQGTVSNISLVDVMPTILHRMGIGVPEGLDGQVIHNVIERDFIEYVEPLPLFDEAADVTDDESVEDRLQALGYVE